MASTWLLMLVRGGSVRADSGGIVETDNRKILGNGEAAGPQSAGGADGRLLIGRKDRCGHGAPLSQALGQIFS